MANYDEVAKFVAESLQRGIQDQKAEFDAETKQLETQLESLQEQAAELRDELEQRPAKLAKLKGDLLGRWRSSVAVCWICAILLAVDGDEVDHDNLGTEHRRFARQLSASFSALRNRNSNEATSGSGLTEQVRAS